MRRLPLRARITAAFALLITMALVEAAIVLYVQRESSLALDETLRTQKILLDEALIRASLGAMQAALRGFVLMEGADELTIYREQRATYDRLARETAGLIRDGTESDRFDRITELAGLWHEAADTVIAETQAGRDVTGGVASLALQRFAQLQRELDRFVARQQGLSRTADENARLRIRNATIILTAIPLLAVVFMFGLLVASRRSLRPLGAVVESALRLARGDYDAPLPRTGTHEIGALIGAFSHMRAAVQERAAEAAAARQRAHKAHAELLGVLDTAPVALAVLNVDGSIRLQNRAADHLIGERRAGTDASSFWQRFTIRDSSGRVVAYPDLPGARALAGVEVVGEEIDLQRPDGRRLDALVGAVPLRDEEGRITGAVASLQDITRLRELDRLKDEFVAIVSHELRTPLSAIRGALQLLFAEQAVREAEHRELLQVAVNSCERLVRIVNDMLDLSKIEAGLQLRLGPQAVDALVRQATQGVQTLATSGDVEIRLNLAPNLPPVRGDADRLIQVLVNLLSNAIKFAPRGTALTVTAAPVEQAVAFSVADRGPGIAPADLPRLFQKFQQLDTPGTRRVGGTGLGLVITKAIIEEHGGTISVESVVGEGTTFTFTVPAEVGGARPGAPAPEARALTGTEHAPAVLIIDDRDASRASLAHALHAAGLRPVESGVGSAALEIAQRERPAAIILSVTSRSPVEEQIVAALGRDPATRHIPLLIAFDGDDLSSVGVAALEGQAADLAARVARLLEDGAHRRILVADDDADARAVLRKVLERHGFQVIEAADGAEALDLASRQRPDLVVLDLRMPRVHGHDVIRTLRLDAATAGVPIVVLSGSGGERQSLYSLVLGANAFMTKPTEPSALVREIDRLIRREERA
ncbi:MAG: hypothetical protein A3I61_10090 [Acidobacteria bacterium RIFCSPLOWO2_02_FULL_68_18]|nr:MAG: hypothetical protein A3I61_10090 [Acidobacteria bacterium RIFCSPLOWO2_02_FULL_68_18]OFW50949.1 MAG: hypothetical protein A3G77_15080 [Acidobacteria bacterium RIFCSPLOWO2_12_FULL_68_19]